MSFSIKYEPFDDPGGSYDCFPNSLYLYALYLYSGNHLQA